MIQIPKMSAQVPQWIFKLTHTAKKAPRRHPKRYLCIGWDPRVQNNTCKPPAFYNNSKCHHQALQRTPGSCEHKADTPNCSSCNIKPTHTYSGQSSPTAGNLVRRHHAQNQLSIPRQVGQFNFPLQDTPQATLDNSLFLSKTHPKRH